MANEVVDNKIAETPEVEEVEEVEENFLDYDSDLFGTDESELFKNIEDSTGNVNVKMNPDTEKELNSWDPESNEGDVALKFERVDSKNFGEPDMLKDPKKSITDVEIIKPGEVQKTKMVELPNGRGVIEVPLHFRITDEWLRLQGLDEKQQTFIRQFTAGIPGRQFFRGVFKNWEDGFGFTGKSQAAAQVANLGFQVGVGIYGGKGIDSAARYLNQQGRKALRLLGSRKLDPYMAKMIMRMNRLPGAGGIKKAFIKLAGTSATLTGYALSNFATETLGQWSGVYKRDATAKYISLMSPYMMRIFGSVVYRPAKHLIRRIPIWGNPFEQWKVDAGVQWFNDVNKKFRDKFLKENNIFTRLGLNLKEGSKFARSKVTESAHWDKFWEKYGEVHIPTNIFHTQNITKIVDGKEVTEEMVGLREVIEDGISLFAPLRESPSATREIKDQASAIVNQLSFGLSLVKNPIAPLLKLKTFIEDIGNTIGKLTPTLDKMGGGNSDKLRKISRLKQMYGTFFNNVENGATTGNFSEITLDSIPVSDAGDLTKLSRMFSGKPVTELLSGQNKLLIEGKEKYAEIMGEWGALKLAYKNRTALEDLNKEFRKYWKPTPEKGYRTLEEGEVAIPTDTFDIGKWLQKLRAIETMKKYKNLRDGIGIENLKDLIKFTDWLNTKVGFKTGQAGSASLSRIAAQSTFAKKITAGFMAMFGMQVLGQSQAVQSAAGIIGAGFGKTMVRLTSGKGGQKLLKSLMGVRDYEAPKELWGQLFRMTPESIRRKANWIATASRASGGPEEKESPMTTQFLKDAAVLAHWIGIVDKGEKQVEQEKSADLNAQQIRARNVKRFERR